MRELHCSLDFQGQAMSKELSPNSERTVLSQFGRSAWCGKPKV
jgi:hypothetical protein